MPIAFPNLKPSARSYSPGEYPQTAFQGQNGAVTVVRFGSRRVDSKLDLTFNNIPDADAASIMKNYEEVNGVWDYVTFTGDNGAVGAGITLATFIEESGGSGLRWRYAGPPKLTSVMPGFSSIVCSFVGVLDGA